MIKNIRKKIYLYKFIIGIFFSFIILLLILNIYFYKKIEQVDDIKKVINQYSNFENQNEIDILKNKIALLKEANSYLKQKLHQKDITYNDTLKNIQNLQNKNNTLLDEQLNMMDTKDIIGTLKNYMAFDEDLVSKDMSIREFSKELIKIAIGKDTNFVDLVNHNHNDLKFVKDLKDDSNENNSFDSNSSKIYAKFDTSSFSDGKILVKWEKNDGELLYMNFYNIKKNSKDNFIWMKKDNGWDKGKYNVHIYSPSNRLKKIYTSSYSIY